MQQLLDPPEDEIWTALSLGLYRDKPEDLARTLMERRYSDELRLAVFKEYIAYIHRL